LRKRFPTWAEVNAARRTSIEKEIRIAGLGQQKSRAIKEILSGLYKKYGTFSLRRLEINSNEEVLDELTSFNGVGVKTASCVLLFAMGRNICPVDTHVHRTVNRIGIVNAATPDKTFSHLNENFPPKIAHSFHTNLIRLGREVCKPKNPGCGICPLITICLFEEKNINNNKSTAPNSFMLLDHI
jgi:endonuclease-3